MLEESLSSPSGHSHEQLRQTEERFRLMIEAVKDYAIFMLDSSGRVTTWNPGAQRLKGYTADEIIGQHFSRFYPPEDIAAHKPELELEIAAREGKVEDEGWRVRKDGSLIWSNVLITALRNGDGELVGFVKVTRDMSAARTAALQQEALIAALRRSNQELQDFAMVASHDLQEPLRKVQMFSDRLRSQFGSQLPPKAQDYLARMEGAAARGQSLILGLLTYSRVTTKAQPFAQVDLNAIASEVISDLESRLAQVSGRIEVVGTLPTIEADPLQMRQLLQNLFGNALKFHKPDVPPVVRIRAQPADAPEGLPLAVPTAMARGWILCVEDNGIGFDEKYSDRIFRLFQRLHERGAYEGAGMGLAIVKKIVERHGGTISVKSQPGEGTTFCIHLPETQPKLEATT